MELIWFSQKITCPIQEGWCIKMPPLFRQQFKTSAVKVDLDVGGACLILSRLEDVYFTGKKVDLKNNCLTLPLEAIQALKLNPGEALVCQYNKMGDIFTLRKK